MTFCLQLYDFKYFIKVYFYISCDICDYDVSLNFRDTYFLFYLALYYYIYDSKCDVPLFGWSMLLFWWRRVALYIAATVS